MLVRILEAMMIIQSIFSKAMGASKSLEENWIYPLHITPPQDVRIVCVILSSGSSFTK